MAEKKKKQRTKECKTVLYGKTRKATGFKSLRVNSCPTGFLNKNCKKQ